jgi:hypothetical protein
MAVDVPTHHPPDRAWRTDPLVLLALILATRNELTMDFENDTKSS